METELRIKDTQCRKGQPRYREHKSENQELKSTAKLNANEHITVGAHLIRPEDTQNYATQGYDQRRSRLNEHQAISVSCCQTPQMHSSEPAKFFAVVRLGPGGDFASFKRLTTVGGQNPYVGGVRCGQGLMGLGRACPWLLLRR